ncbi:hypothetical protein J6X13_02020 [Candidatus Saccharibacteria bacterium]|nr:hypothetical protein [Candidatus Saccharibacteria bacterium]
MSKKVKNKRQMLREFILDMEYPFCLPDLKVEARKHGFSPKDMEILVSVLKELNREGVVYYDEIPLEDRKPGCSNYAYYVPGH